ncbi:trypsin-like peptidase domain-containing protein [Desulfogranum mediterraneum]|uniref:trypsin-like peptidase domain-containing protein n=1 Tax=Desulfogranum mediterraneum TaxID=160661 RepID=UPI0003FA6D4B|nr:trypsin-like peptidase domain-containing protein [Desulfogranum mediterraneum]
MKCPKCGFVQPRSPECSQCGIFIDKYLAAQARKEELRQAAADQPVGRSFPLMSLVGLLAVVAAAGWWLLGLRTAPVPQEVAPELAVVEKIQAGGRADQGPGGQPTRSSEQLSPVESAPGDGLAGQLATSFGVSNAIEAARNATVSIVTPWGSGSGFFIDPHGTIITNRHVVEYDPASLERLIARARELKQQLDTERHSLDLVRRQLGQIREQEFRAQLKRNLRLREKRYAEYFQRYTGMEEQIATIQEGDFLQQGSVELIDGSAYQVDSVQLSPGSDLAMVSISVYNSPFLQPAASREYLEQGKTVYTIGSPSGLRHTITSGIISGFRRFKEQPLIQIDAPINPGNSGGPLINDQGQVLGVNTMIISNTEGIGFAIPFAQVAADFPGSVSAE